MSTALQLSALEPIYSEPPPPQAATADPFRRLRIAAGGVEGLGGDLASTLVQSKIDLHPHQVEAALFALSRPFGRGAILADEVGLGKTIEAGLVISQILATGGERVLVLVPASLRMQWKRELARFFDIDAHLVDLRVLRRARGLYSTRGVHIASYSFYANETNPPEFREADWDLVVLDEAHRLRNVFQPGARRARRLREQLRGKRKILLTATPFQNSILELFGLVSFVDEKLLGSDASFRSRFLADDRGLEMKNGDELRARLSSVVTRTLRRQVKERIRFTDRTSLLFDFEPTPAEQDLYEHLSAYLSNAKGIALAFGNRELFLLLCRKILASSTFAIAATLRRLVLTLTERLAGNLGQIELYDDVDGFEDELDEIGEGGGRRGADLSREDLEGEIAQLRYFAALAESISVNAKGERLVGALDQVFAHSREMGWPEKAVIFTESRRTQDYLARRLDAAGWAGNVTLLNGQSGDAVARDARVQEFRDRTQILLTTEVGAEGLNLQFCNIIVNYDLPWNPQRIEQRIGRCHRYGQKRDVVVVNFLNTGNAADSRLYELLSAKLALFDGVFGSSDEILGSLESGVGFERRVLEIYQRCQAQSDVDAAFDRLESEIEEVSSRVGKSGPSLLDGFDDEVRDRLEQRASRLDAQLAKVQADVQELVSSCAERIEPVGDGVFEVEIAADVVASMKTPEVPDRIRFSCGDGGELIGPQHPLIGAMCDHTLEIEGSPRVHELMVHPGDHPALATLRGERGYWFVYRIRELAPDEKSSVVETIVLEGRDAPVSDDEQEAILGADYHHAGYAGLGIKQPCLDVAEAVIVSELARRAQRAQERVDALVKDERRRLERFATETLNEARRQVARARASSLKARDRLRQLERDDRSDADARREAKGIVDLFEGQFRHEEKLLIEDGRRYAREADTATGELRERLQVRAHRRLLGAARIWIV